MNTQAERLFGYNRAELVSRSLDTLLLDRERAGPEETAADAIGAQARDRAFQDLQAVGARSSTACARTARPFRST